MTRILGLRKLTGKGNRLLKIDQANHARQPRRSFKNDVYGMAFFADQVKNHPNLNLYVPKVYETAVTIYIREYIADDPMGIREIGAKRSQLAAGAISQIIGGYRPAGTTRPGRLLIGSSNYRNLHQSIAVLADENQQAGIITSSQTTSCKNRLRRPGRLL